MAYDREELVTIGERFPSDLLADWGRQLAGAARQDLRRLEARGITADFLSGIESACDEVQALHDKSGRGAPSLSPAAVERHRAMELAADWRAEAQGLAAAVFDSDPDRLARFRRGIKTSRSLPKLAAELRLLLEALRHDLPALHGVGVSVDFIARGEQHLRRLEEARPRLHDELARLPELAVDLRHTQGILYTRVRFLARLARIEFRGEPERLARYGYGTLRSENVAVGSKGARSGRRASAISPS